MAAADGLSRRQRDFVAHYVIGLNAARAYRDAGYKVGNDNVACAGASRLLRNVKVAAAIEAARAEAARALEITRDMVLEGLKAEATRVDEGSSHSARVSAWGLLGKHLGMFLDRTRHETDPENPPRVEVTVADELAPYADVVRGLVGGVTGPPPEDVRRNGAP